MLERDRRAWEQALGGLEAVRARCTSSSAVAWTSDAGALFAAEAAGHVARLSELLDLGEAVVGAYAEHIAEVGTNPVTGTS